MKKSEAIEIIKEILISGNPDQLQEHALIDAKKIIEKLENLNIIDSSQFGSVCSRCNRKSWDPEC